MGEFSLIDREIIDCENWHKTLWMGILKISRDAGWFTLSVKVI